MMDRDEIPASPEAISICAPYGNNPWIMHENVSRMLAVLRGSRPKRVVMSFAIRPVVRMAMVLFAVQTLAMLTSAAILNSAPRFPLIPFVRIRTR